MPKPRQLSPIERMIDEACGVPANFVPKSVDPDPQCDLCEKRASMGCRCWVRLRCADCDDTTTVERVVAEDGDDDEVVTLCPDCAPVVPESVPPRSA